MAKVKVEFIESYIHEVDEGGSYIWNDNHGELIRCKDCKHGEPFLEKIRCGSTFDRLLMCPDDYCSYGARKEKPHDKM